MNRAGYLHAMPSNDGPSKADQQLIDHAASHGLAITAKQLDIWRRAGLLAGNIPGGGLGRGRGSTSTPPPESFELVLALARRSGRGKRPTDLALLLFADGHPVPEATVRTAFRAAVNSPPEAVNSPPDADGDPDEQLELETRIDHVADRLAETGQTFVLVPARARRIDERIARVLGGPPEELAELDANGEPTPMTPQDASLAAVTAALGGTVSVREIGDLLRGMNPGMTAHPFASLVETTQRDVPDAADLVLTDEGSLAFLPEGNASDHLYGLADTASLEEARLRLAHGSRGAGVGSEPARAGRERAGSRTARGSCRPVAERKRAAVRRVCSGDPARTPLVALRLRPFGPVAAVPTTDVRHAR